METLFRQYLRHSCVPRPEYEKSLGAPDPRAGEKLRSFWQGSVPRLIEVIYQTVSGTRRSIKDQALMDFIPGYYLIHIDELSAAYATLSRLTGRQDAFPLLANYSDDYICIIGDEIYDFLHDDASLDLIHTSGEDFLRTRCAFYEEQVYFLDDNGFLDSHSDKEDAIAVRLNPGIAYWAGEDH